MKERIEEIKKRVARLRPDSYTEWELSDINTLLTAIEERDRKIEELNTILSPSDPMKYTMYKKLIARVEQAEAKCKGCKDYEVRVATLQADLGTVDMAGVLSDMDRRQTIKGLRDQLAVAREAYQELIMAVGKKYPNETRHQTALRYIKEREEGSQHADAKASP